MWRAAREREPSVALPALTTTYTGEPFGLREVSGTPNTNPFRFTGRENDGTGLSYYRARYYDPKGRVVHFRRPDRVQWAAGGGRRRTGA